MTTRPPTGGARFGGIEPALESGNLFVYTDPAAGQDFGYDFDGWLPDEEVFLYTGHGQEGDQELSGRNLTLSTHVERGLRVRLFVADGLKPGTHTKLQRYVGEFRIDQNRPYTIEDGPDKNGELRSLLVFRLDPVDSHGDVFEADSDLGTSSETDVVLVSLEEHQAKEFTQEGDATPRTARRREAELVELFADYLAAMDHEAVRHKITLPDSAHPMFTDLHDLTDNVLYEAKGSASRSDIRLAIGQLYDYRRYITDPEPDSLAVLLPTVPAQDMLDLLSSLGIACVHRLPGDTFSKA